MDYMGYIITIGGLQMMTYLCNVENELVYQKNWSRSLTNFYFTQEAHENPNTYESDSDKDNFYSYNIIKKAFINVIFAERVHQVAFEKSKNNLEFCTAEEDSSRSFSQLKESLTTEEQKELLLELESAWNKMYGIFLEYSYCQGLADSQMIHKELEKYGISVVKETSRDNYGSSSYDSLMLM